MSTCTLLCITIVLSAVLTIITAGELSIRLPILIRDFNPKTKVWECNFDVNDCDIINEYNFASQFKLKHGSPLLGKNHYYYLESTNARGSGVARLQTPYIPSS